MNAYALMLWTARADLTPGSDDARFSEAAWRRSLIQLLAVLSWMLALALASPTQAQGTSGPATRAPSAAAAGSTVPEAVDKRIRASIGRELPDAPAIDEIRAAPIRGLFEVRMRDVVIYTDAEAKAMIRGDIIELASGNNLTRERLETSLAIPFQSLALKDAIVWKRGTGERRIAVFADPRCPFCKKLETELESLRDVTVYTFLIPILGPDSTDLSRKLWCSRDRGTTWHAWMTKNTPPAEAAECDAAALDRNLAFARQHRIVATPTVIFESGRRVAGALPLVEIERRLGAATAALQPR